jgi:hypothetical protein
VPPTTHIPVGPTIAPQVVAINDEATSHHSSFNRPSGRTWTSPHEPGSQRWHSPAKTHACSRLATTNQPASAAGAPVTMFTATVTPPRANASTIRHRERNCTTAHTAETPAAGQTMLRLDESITVRRPA